MIHDGPVSSGADLGMPTRRAWRHKNTRWKTAAGHKHGIKLMRAKSMAMALRAGLPPHFYEILTIAA
jgi:hypothetical protein